jgi:hypothetical protein
VGVTIYESAGELKPQGGSEPESYVVVTVWSLCCTLALLAVLILALVSAWIPSGR